MTGACSSEVDDADETRTIMLNVLALGYRHLVKIKKGKPARC